MIHKGIEILSPCKQCQEPQSLPFEFTMAFQPIVNVRDHSVFAYESLVRGVDGAGAGAILAQVTTENRYVFDQLCRVKSVELASRLRLPGYVSINFLPNAVYKPETCIRATLAAAEKHSFPTERIIFEITESEELVDKEHLKSIVREYKRQGFMTAIDDFGAGYSGLQLLAEFQPDLIKLDMGLLRNIDRDAVRQAIVKGICATASALGIEIIAEGIESLEELAFLESIGIELFQGYLFAKPQVESLPVVNWP